MKDIDTILKENTPPKPRRPLRSDFTNTILDKISEKPASPRSRLKEFFAVKLFTKPVFTTFAIAIGVIGSGAAAYAVVGGWPGVVALFGGQTSVSDGRVVKVNTENCQLISSFNITSIDKQQNEYFYKIKSGSKLTNEQVVQMVKGYCTSGEQATFSMTTILPELAKNPLNKDRMVGNYIDSVVTAISPDRLSLESEWPIGEEIKVVRQTFTNIDPDVLVYDGPNRLSFADIQVGDRVSVTYRTSDQPSETLDPSKLDTSKQTILAVIKNSADLSAAISFQKYQGSEFEQVVPCDKGTDGFCNTEQFHSGR